ncbi:hypothetical protein [Telmatospirillum sp.]|uniref:hypothetical protein n=1 Tax=Telmatospirillum sp. TaxID=2079197 RepID=UPI00284EA919|nr:hypothetical protein [Telmatospirillum sp.]MDR3438933.1 hypothetical protein [Telmatospirillum sp.]
MTPLAYLKVGGAAVVALLIVAAVWYVGDLRTQVADGRAQIAAQTATINELDAAHQADQKALAELQAAKERDEAALTADAGQQQAIVQTVTQWKEKIIHVPVASDACRALDARDLAAFDGVRGLLAGSADRANTDSQDSAAGRTDGGHSAASSAGQPDKP